MGNDPRDTFIKMEVSNISPLPIPPAPILKGYLRTSSLVHGPCPVKGNVSSLGHQGLQPLHSYLESAPSLVLTRVGVEA